MKKSVLIFLVCALAAAGCTKDSDRHASLRGEKNLTVEQSLLQGFTLGYEADTISLSFGADCYWRLEFLSWKQPKEGQMMTLETAGWMSAPLTIGQGDAGGVKVYLSANNRSNEQRKGYVKISTGDPSVYAMIPICQMGNPDWEGPTLEPFNVHFDFYCNPMGWPTESQSIGTYVYTVDETEYSFYLGQCNASAASYLVVYGAGCCLGLPAVEYYKLSKVVVDVTHNAKTRRAIIASDTSGSVVTGGEEQEWTADLSEITYKLKDTEAGVQYYVYATYSGLPIDGLTLYYKP